MTIKGVEMPYIVNYLNHNYSIKVIHSISAKEIQWAMSG